MALRRSLWLAVGGCAVATLLVVLLPDLAFSYRGATLRAAAETALGIFAALGMLLGIGRFRRTSSRRDLLVASALGALAVANLGLTAVPLSVGLTWPGFLWLGLGVRTLGAVAIAAASLSSDRRARTRELLVWIIIGITALAAIGVAVAVAWSGFPRLSDITIGTARSPHLSDDPLITGPPLLAALMFSIAALGFYRHSAPDGRDVGGPLAAGCVFEAFAHINYVLSPSLYGDRFHTGDLLRLVGYILWLSGAAREIASYWTSLAVDDERRRIARDLHDGLAQELAFISSMVPSLARKAGEATVMPIRDAADRALGEARRAINALTAEPGEPLEVAVRRTVAEVADRAGVAVDVDMGSGLRVSPSDQEQIIRIVREAVTNAIRHGGATAVTVSTRDRPQPALEVTDNGCGFDPAKVTGGFGVTSMRERAERIGAQLSVRSEEGHGTTVAVRWP